MSGIENSNLRYTSDEYKLHLEKEGEEYSVEGNESEDNNKSVTIFSTYDNDNNTKADYKNDASTKALVDAGRSVSESSNLSDTEKSLLNGKLNSIWSQQASGVSCGYDNVECNINYVSQEQARIDSLVKEEIQNQIRTINAQVQEEYNQVVAQVKADTAKADAEKAAENEPEPTPEAPKRMPVGVATTISRGIQQVNQTSNIVSNMGNIASNGLSIAGEVNGKYINHLSQNAEQAIKDHSLNDFLRNNNNAARFQNINTGIKVAGAAVDVGMTAYNTYNAIQADGGLMNDDGSINMHAAADGYREAARGTGSIVGANIGATVGSAVPVVGTLAGSYVGSKIGGEVGADIADAQIEAVKIFKDDNTALGGKVIQTAELAHNTTVRIEKDVVNVAADVVGDASKVVTKYATPLASAEIAAQALGLEEVSADLEKAESLVDDYIDGTTGAAANTLNAGISVLEGDLEAAKQEINEAKADVHRAVNSGVRLAEGTVRRGKSYAQRTGNAVDDGITNVAHKAKNTVKKTLNSVKVNTSSNSNSINAAAGRAWNSGVDAVYEAGSETYHTLADGYNSMKKKGKSFLKSLGWS